jgi:hypothetical protein
VRGARGCDTDGLPTAPLSQCFGGTLEQQRGGKRGGNTSLE